MVAVRDERGGAIWGFLSAIGLVVVLLAILFAACFNSATGQTVQHRSLGRPVLVRHDRPCRADCDDGGGNGASGGDYGHGKNGDQGDAGHDQCHSFCNNVIVVPDPTAPKQLTNPSKLPAVIQSIIKGGLDLGQLFATGTIKFVEDLFTALA